MVTGTSRAPARAGSLVGVASISIALLFLASCTVRPATQVMVFVDAEPGVRAATASVEILVEGSTGRGGDEFAQRQLSDVVPSWPIRVALTPLDGDAQRVYRVTARARDAVGTSAAIVAEVRAISGYRSGEAVRIDLVLQDACLGHAPCANDQTCRAGVCVSAAIDPMTLAPLDSDAGAYDAGPDGGAVLDAGDAGPGDAGPGDAAPADGGPDGGWTLPTEERILVASDAMADDQLGWSVALSADGTRAIVGVPFDDTARGADAGSAHVFVRAGSEWDHEAQLLTTLGQAGDQLGNAVALDATGTRALVGAVGDDTGSTGIGSVRVFVRIGSSWAQETTLFGLGGAFGTSVALSADGTRALVGASTDGGAGPGTGSARVFIRSGGSWNDEQTLVPSPMRAFDYFGAAVSLSADGSHALVGAPQGPEGAGGNAFVFSRVGSTWTQQVRLVAADGAAGDSFGSAVALSSDGTRALIGAPGDDVAGVSDAGSVRVFTRVDVTWSTEATLLGSGASAGESVGASVAVSADGSRVLASAGTARLFVRTDTSWGSDVPLAASGAGFVGERVALSADGDIALLGAPGDGSAPGSARAFVISWP